VPTRLCLNGYPITYIYSG